MKIPPKQLIAGLPAAMALLLGPACSGDGANDERAARPTPSTTTAPAPAPTTTSPTTPTTTSTATKPPPPAPAPVDLAAGPNIEDSGPSGDGCAPGDVAVLPDGWWAGSITSADDLDVEFDVVCWFAGPAASQAAVEDGMEEFGHDHYIRNHNPRTVSTRFASATGLARLPALEASADGSGFVTVTIADFLEGQRLLRNGSWSMTTAAGEAQLNEIVWVHVSGGVADYVFSEFTC
jgi:hypothetical protein